MSKMLTELLIVLIATLCCAHDQKPYNNLSERIGNFSIEALYHTSRILNDEQNIIMAPLTIWTVLAAIGAGAQGDTEDEIYNAIKWSRRRNKSNDFKEITQWLKADTKTVQLTKINAMFIDKNRSPLQEYQEIAKKEYEMDVLSLYFSDSVNVANALNRVISNITHGLIKNIVDTDYFQDTDMVLTSALYFKGQWLVPFNSSLTKKQPFYDSKGQKIGEVNMMYNRYTYPLTNVRKIQARVLELPYGEDDKFSMFVLLPNPGVPVENMLRNFQNIDLDIFFEELRISKEDYPDDEVDLYLPRFKVESDLDLVDVLKYGFGIKQLFDPKKASLPLIARTPLYVSKIVHKAMIEMTEEGTTAAAVTIAKFKSRSGIVTLNVNRPFAYLIVEKVTNSIILGGFYKEPSLY